MAQYDNWKLGNKKLAALICTAAAITFVLSVPPLGIMYGSLGRIFAGLSCLSLLYLGYDMFTEDKRQPTTLQWAAWMLVLTFMCWFLLRALMS